jgi:hypothetical protein
MYILNIRGYMTTSIIPDPLWSKQQTPPYADWQHKSREPTSGGVRGIVEHSLGGVTVA